MAGRTETMLYHSLAAERTMSQIWLCHALNATWKNLLDIQKKWVASTDRITYDRKVHLASLLISLGVTPPKGHSTVQNQQQTLDEYVGPEPIEFEITDKSEEADLRLFE